MELVKNKLSGKKWGKRYRREEEGKGDEDRHFQHNASGFLVISTRILVISWHAMG